MTEASIILSDELNLESPILVLLGRADQVVNHMYSVRLKKFGLTNTQYLVLLTVANNPGLTQTEIVVQSGIDRSTLGNLLQRLEKRRLVHRMYSQGNSKSKRCFVTHSALRLLSEVDRLHLDIDREIQALVPWQHWEDFVLALRILSDVHQSGIKNGGFSFSESSLP